MSLDEIYRRLEREKKAKAVPASTVPSDFQGLLENMIRQAVAEHFAGQPLRDSTPKSSGRVNVHLADIQRRLEKAKAAVQALPAPAPVDLPAPVPSVLPPRAPQQVPHGVHQMVIRARDELGRIARVSFVAPDGKTFNGTVTMRDELGRVARAEFEEAA